MKRSQSATERMYLPEHPHASARVQPWGILCLFGIVLALALWRVLLACGIGVSLSIQWRELESLIAWIALALLLLLEPGAITPESLRERRVGGIVAAVLALSAILAGTAQVLLETEMSGTASNAPEIIGFSADALLALCGVAIAFRELKRMLRRVNVKSGSGEPAGLTLLDLWRFAAVQWGLLMVAAIVYLRVRVSPEDAAGNEQIRRLLFFLPAAGVIPNAMMAGGIAAWDWIAGRQNLRAPPRLRAWLVALGAINFGAVLLVVRPAFLGIPGGAVAAAAIAFYLVGFPPSAWRTLGGKIIFAAWILLAVGLAAAVLERVFELGNGTTSSFYGSAWRHVWGAGAIGLWLIGTGFWLVEREAAGRGIRRAALLSAGFFGVGTLLTAAVFLAATTQAGAGQFAVLHWWLLAGSIPELLGLLIAGLALLRLFRSFKNSVRRASATA